MAQSTIPHHCAISENQLRRSLPPTLPTLSLSTLFSNLFSIRFQFVLIQVFHTALNNRFRHRFQNTAMSPTFRRSQVTEYRDRYRSHRELSRQSTSPSGQIANARPFLATNRNLVRDIPIPSATLSAPITRCCPQRIKTKTVEPHSLSLSFETTFLLLSLCFDFCFPLKLLLAFDLFNPTRPTHFHNLLLLFLYFYRNPTAIPTAPNPYRTRDFNGDFPFPLPLD